jgi:hypothetical protein
MQNEQEIKDLANKLMQSGVTTSFLSAMEMAKSMVKTETKVNKAQKADFATFDNMTKSAIKKAQEVYPSHDPELNKTNEETFGFASGFSQDSSFRDLYAKNKGEYDKHFRHLKVKETENNRQQNSNTAQFAINQMAKDAIQRNEKPTQVKQSKPIAKADPTVNQIIQQKTVQQPRQAQTETKQNTQEKPKIDINSIFDVNREK